MAREKYLLKLYNSYINKSVYRVVPQRDIKNILKNGINPKNNPYKNIIPKIKLVEKTIKILGKKGISIEYHRGDKKVSADFIIKEILTDLSKKYIDFCSSKEHVKYYLLAIPGGGIPNAVKKVNKKLLELNLPISKKEKLLIKKLNIWASALICKNTVISVKGTPSIFETALFQLTGTHKNKKRKKFKESPYLPSPFGSFEHFKKIIKKHGLKKYSYRLKNNKFYLRVKEKIPAEEIKLIKP